MTASFADAWVAVAGVEGWLTEGQAEELFDAARACPSGGTIVEIGSFRGRSTIVLALGAADGTRVMAIDPHAGNDRGPQEIEGFETEAADDHQTFLRNLTDADVADLITHVRKSSGEALADVEADIDVLFIDGAHRYGPARADIRDYGARVSEGGIMLIHDSFSSVGVTGAILRELVWSTRWRYVRRSRSLAVYERARHDRRPVNAGHQLAQLPWFAKNVAIKVLLTAGLGGLLKPLGLNAPDWPY